jgi:hypothetical protein
MIQGRKQPRSTSFPILSSDVLLPKGRAQQSPGGPRDHDNAGLDDERKQTSTRRTQMIVIVHDSLGLPFSHKQ